MSTYVYLQCLDHNPPLRAESESGQHLSDLPQLRKDISARGALVAAAALDLWPHRSEYFRRNTILFLQYHTECNLGIIDEYGTEHPTDAPDA